MMAVGGRAAYHVEKLRAEVDRIRADIERQRGEIEGQGFQKLENEQLAGLFGVAHWSEMHSVELAAFNLARHESPSKQLTDGGYQREFLGDSYYHVQKLKDLVAIGKTNLAALEDEGEAPEEKELDVISTEGDTLGHASRLYSMVNAWYGSAGVQGAYQASDSRPCGSASEASGGQAGSGSAGSRNR